MIISPFYSQQDEIQTLQTNVKNNNMYTEQVIYVQISRLDNISLILGS